MAHEFLMTRQPMYETHWLCPTTNYILSLIMLSMFSATVRPQSLRETGPVFIKVSVKLTGYWHNMKTNFGNFTSPFSVSLPSIPQWRQTHITLVINSVKLAFTASNSFRNLVYSEMYLQLTGAGSSRVSRITFRQACLSHALTVCSDRSHETDTG